ncbi:hypothetical protein CP967_08565 [Streptomyces nitrosporeus]|uniref:Uncharacterized protein n=1 Tax=Streptomyces nitrosporeus TaxID=28894 RepID=A0A5J6F8T6_9ACTN|nr:hypothetical protein [Streptomyces nitrosporeus]QEU72014.1 hypothetical protein CP967_08565 [Streptomyces nitrosporeus]GGY81264.1 hypothetical protein GCM10010327_09880 [Streptomyces nitrosporeus]
MTVIDLFKKKAGPADEAERQEPGEETERQAAARELREAVAALTGRLGRGSLWICQGCTQGLAAWCRRGRRDDLDGPAAEYGVWGRGLVLAGLAVGGWLAVSSEPVILAPAAGIWVLAALHAKEPPEPEDEAPAEDAAEAEGGAPAEPPVVALVRAQIGDEKGVHLSVLYPAMRASLPGAEKAPDEALRQLLRDHRIPTRRSVRVGGVAGRSGVHRDDLPPLPSPGGSESGDSALSARGDAGQGQGAESGGEARRGAGDGPESGGDITARLVQDPENPVRWTVAAS